jgi:hypothetical protein
MRLARRRFLAWLGATAVAGAGMSWWRREPVGRWLLSAPLTGERPGPLRDSTAATLRAATLALLYDRVEPLHYVECFRWRAEHVRGARALYERFEAAVDRAARSGGHTDFRAATPAARRRVLERMLPARGWMRVRRAVFARDEARYARHVVREVFRRFSRTDAWVLSGYDAWPGMPRAIARLRRGGPAS